MNNKTAIVYYSLEGNTKFIAEIIAKETKGELIELQPKKAYPTSKYKKYFWGGKSVMLKEKPELLNGAIHLENYETIFIGTPVWAGTFAPPLLTLLSSTSISNKNIALFACHGGGGAEKCFKHLHTMIKNNHIVGEIAFEDPLWKNSLKNTEATVQWIHSLFSSHV